MKTNCFFAALYPGIEANNSENIDVWMVALDGARILLLDRARLREIHDLLENLYCVQFASVPDFLVRMQAAKFIPHTDMNRYPSIKKRLRE